MKPLDNPSYCFPHPRNVAEALLRDHLLQRNSEREHTVGGSRISLRSIRISRLKGGALPNLAEQSGDLGSIKSTHDLSSVWRAIGQRGSPPRGSRDGVRVSDPFVRYVTMRAIERQR